MTYEFLVTVEGTRTGKFSDEPGTDRKGNKLKARPKITGIAFSYGVDSGRDVATGQATGKRVHHPVTFVKQWGAATPQFLAAAFNNELLKSVLFEFVRTSQTGEEQVFHKITLTNASISEIEQFIDHDDEDANDARPLEKITLLFQKIEIENVDGKTIAADDFGSP